ncbi:MAG: GUN4 domain-containing protein [Kovacikia sp.]
MPPTPDPTPEPKPEKDHSDSGSLSSQANQVQRQFVQPAVQALIQWSPLGGSVGLFVHFLVQQEWMLTLLTFPVLIVTTIWAKYTEGFLTRLGEVASDRGRQDVESLGTWMGNLDQALRWQLAKPEAKYLQCQARECFYTDVEGYKQPDDIKIPLLEEVFVPLELSGDFSLNPRGDVMPIQMGSRRSGMDHILEKQMKQGSLTIWDLLARARKEPAYARLAILAWGGYGKTTLLRHITYTYAKHRYRRYHAPKLVPILLYLRKWRELLAQANAPSLPDLITQHHIPDLPGGKQLALPPNWADSLLKRGDALVMLDGFDEVTEDQRQAVSQWISQQMRDYGSSLFILTSRPGGYKDYKAAEKPHRNLFVKPFNPDQWQAFIRKWYVCQERHSRSGSDRNLATVTALAEQRATDLIQQILQREELSAMATNPLLLNMIATFHRFYPGSELPRRRTELYQAICQLQLGGRPEYKRIPMPLSASDSQAVLQYVALAMVHYNKPTVRRKPLADLIQKCLTQLEAEIAPLTFLDQIVKVSELLVEREPEEYEFAHLSFQGYLAAAQIKKLNREDLLLQNWDKSWWRETILLYAAQVNPTNLLRELSNRGAADLAWRCLQESPRRDDPSLEAELRPVAARVQDLRYQALENYLKNGQWEKADQETYRLMITTVGKEDGQWFEPEDLLTFPCEELRAIDGLWVQYSNGQFGFSVQKEIYLKCGGIPDGKYDKETWDQFCHTTGWKVNDQRVSATYNTSAPPGHLPRGGAFRWVFGRVFSSLASRLVKCNL